MVLLTFSIVKSDAVLKSRGMVKDNHSGSIEYDIKMEEKG